MNTYETMVLLDNREVKKGWDALKSDVCGLFAKHDAEVVSARRWEERRLAYPINGQLRATYMLVYHNAPTDSITPINRELMYSQLVLRHMTVTCEEIPQDAYEPEAEFDASLTPVGDEKPAEEEAPAEEAKAEEGKAEEAKVDEAKAEATEGDANAEKTEEKTEDAPAADADKADDGDKE